MSRATRAPRRGLPAAGVAAPSDRRYRRSDVVPVRRRRAVRTVRNIARWVAIVIGALLIGVWGTDRIVASDMFLVRDVTIRGQRYLSVGQVELLLQGLRSENVFMVDFDHYRQRVLDSSWVEQVSLSRVLPSTIVVDVVERTPVVLARRNQHLYLVDSTGTIIDEHRAEYSEFDLPIADGLLIDGPEGDAHVDDQRMVLVTQLLEALAGRADLEERVSQIDVSNPRNLVAMLDDDPAWLHLGRSAFAERLQRYLDLRPALRDRFGAIDYADLKFDERVYVRGQRNQHSGSLAAR